MRTIAMCLIAASLAAHAHAQCASFQPGYPGLNGAVRVLASWDPDGSGPELPRLVAGGEFTWNQGAGSQDYIAWWDGTQWSNIGWGPDGPVNAITTWDPDGDGPLPPQLVIGGEFPDIGADSTGAITVNYISLWDGEAWQPLGTGADGPVDALTTWDPDGDGPLPAELVAAGRFTHIGGVWTGGVAHWDGTAWHSFGWGIEGSGSTLTVWDPDGDGPEIPNLVVGGSFLDAGAASTGGVDVNNIARWDGAAWRAIGPGLSAPVNTTITFDLGAGMQLLAGGTFGVFAWNGVYWQGFGRGFAFDYTYCSGEGSFFCDHCHEASVGGTALQLLSWDPDGDGPIPPQLIARGKYTYETGFSGGEGCVLVPHTLYPVSLWTGYMFATLDTNSLAVATFDADGDGPGGTRLEMTWRGNAFSTLPRVGDTSFVYPIVDSFPTPVIAHPGESAMFSVDVEGLSPTYQWYKGANGVLTRLNDGPTGYGSTISGAATPMLQISNLREPDVGPYQCSLVYGTCEFERTPQVYLALLGTCTADFNHDGDYGTDADIEAFFACLGGSCCPTCGTADFNGDGDVGTDADINAFFRVLGGGGC